MAKNQKGLERPDWMDYELQILKVFREKHPSRIVLGNQRVKGIHSKRSRQIDVAVFNATNSRIERAIECKHINKQVTLPVLDAFCGKLVDIGIKKGTIVTSKGFSSSTANYARSKGITLLTLDYAYLKDYYYIPPNDVPGIFMKATRYPLLKCDTCDISILYETGEVYGMADHEILYCPKCKNSLGEIRSDANHRIIKIFRGDVPVKETEAVIAKHLHITRNEWACIFKTVAGRNDCRICLHEFCNDPPTRVKTKYKGKNVCSECMMSNRGLLIDHQYN